MMQQRQTLTYLLVLIVLVSAAAFLTVGCTEDSKGPGDAVGNTGSGDSGGNDNGGGDNGGSNGGNGGDSGNGGDNGNSGPTYKRAVFNISSFCECPNWTNGDRDFGGNGPKVELEVTLSKTYDRSQIVLGVDFTARETRPDYTTGSLHTSDIVYTAPSGWKIHDIASEKRFGLSYTDHDHDVDTPTIPSGSLLSYASFKGDTKGPDVGNCTYDDTYFCLYFNQVEVILVKE